MKKICLFFALAAMTLSGASASAQTNDAEELFSTIDVTYSPMSFKMDFGISLKDNLNAFSVNWSQARRIVDSYPIYLQYGAGLQYAWGKDFGTFGFGYEDDYEDYGDYDDYIDLSSGMDVKNSTTFLTLKVPVNVVYKFDLPDTPVSVLPFVGMNLQGHIIGQDKTVMKYDGEKEVSKFSYFSKDDMADDPYNRIVLGWQIGAKVSYDKYLFGVSYEGPISSLYKYKEDDMKLTMKYSQVNISLGIIF